MSKIAIHGPEAPGGTSEDTVQLALSDTQQMFLDTTRKLLDERAGTIRLRELLDDPIGFDRQLWSQGAGLGWYGMLVPEKYGGGSLSGSPLADAAIIAEEMGRTVHPGPFLPTNLVAFALSEYGTDEQRERLLPRLADGSSIATWAYAEPGRDWSTGSIEASATPGAGGFVLNGTKSFVQDATSADVYLVTARTGSGLTQFVVPADAPGITVEPLECLDLGRRMSEVTFREIRLADRDLLGPAAGAGPAVERQLQVALALQCAESNGATAAGLAMTVGYARERVAFGRPIGSYQALKHRLADHRMWLEGSFATTAHAVNSVQTERPDAAVAARVAKAHVGRRSTATLHDCIQIHGGIGMTWEYDLHLYFRRAISNEVLFGAPSEHMQDLVSLVEAAGR